MYYVYSTLTASVVYADYLPRAQDNIPRRRKSVCIKGGANVMTKRGDIPRCYMTSISDEDYECIEKNPVFKKHVADGFVKVDKKPVSVDKMVKDMLEKDDSSPITKTDDKANVKRKHKNPEGSLE